MFLAKLVTSTVLGAVLAGAVGLGAVESRPRCVLGT